MPATPLLATVMPWAPNFPPQGWAFCSGQLLAISQNQALFSILGTMYGGDGRTTFGLPDLRGRLAVGTGSGPGLTPYNTGRKTGAEEVALTAASIPSHTHPVSQDKALEVLATTNDGNQQSPSATNRLSAATLTAGTDANLYSNAAPDTQLGGLSASGDLALNGAGSGLGHENQQPYLVISYVIAIQGVFPSRN
jgi:microcystin-dependent protein